jgi:LCP family protein required for cell wall assembly
LHATRIRPETRPTDIRRLTAAGLSALIPGLGQLFNGRRRLAALFLIPSLILLVLAILVVRSESPARLAAWVVSPQVMGTLLALNVIVLAWRLVAVGQAFLDTRRTGPTGWLGIAGIVVIGILVVLPHLVVYRYGTLLESTFDRIFSGSVLGASDVAGQPRGPEPAGDERINVLLVGTDHRVQQSENLTDTMMVASLDPVGRTVSMVSIPRDLVGTPLGDGDTFGPKLNSLMSYADRHKADFPAGGMRTLEDAVGALLGIPIHYYASLDFEGFIKIVDAVGGVDVKVPNGFDDPTYDGYGFEQHGYGTGYSISAGPHHLDGINALAYARSRKALGESDFTRQARQQQILVALRDRVASGGSLLFQLPDLLEAVGQTIRTDMPVDRLPALAAILQEVGKSDVTSVVIRAPLVKGKNTQFGSSQVPNLDRIRAMAAALFPTPGTDPTPWPTPKPTKAPKATPKPSS